MHRVDCNKLFAASDHWRLPNSRALEACGWTWEERYPRLPRGVLCLQPRAAVGPAGPPRALQGCSSSDPRSAASRTAGRAVLGAGRSAQADSLGASLLVSGLNPAPCSAGPLACFSQGQEGQLLLRSGACCCSQQRGLDQGP